MRTPLLILTLLTWSVVVAPAEPISADEKDSTGQDTSQLDSSNADAATEEEAASAEDSSRDAAEGDAPNAVQRTESAGNGAAPDIYYLPDEQGQLRRVVGFVYEDFLKAWGLAKQTKRAEAPPRAVLDGLRVDGVQRNNLVEIDVEVELRLMSTGWINTPLQLGDIIIQDVRFIVDGDDANAESELRPSLAHDASGAGLSLWTFGKPGATLTVAIRGLAPVEKAGDQQTLHLQLPQAAKSRVELQLLGSDVQAEGIHASGLHIEESDGQPTRVLMAGAEGSIRIAWRPLASRPIDRQQPVEAVGELAINVDRDRVTYEAAYRLDSFGQPLDRIQIQLPPGAVWTGGGGEGYELTLLQQEESEAGQGDLVRVRIANPNVDLPTIRLTAEIAIRTPADADLSVIKITGPMVLEAYRQYGTASLTISKRLQAYFDASDGIEQIARSELPANSLDSAPTAALAYTQPDWSLDVTTRSQQLRVRVEPAYQLHIRADQAELEVDLDYQVTGGRIFEIPIELHGWSLAENPIESGGLIDHGRMLPTADGPLRIPLRDAVDDTLRLHLTLRRPVDFGRYTWSLPEPLRAFVLPGKLSLSSSEDVRATPQPRKMIGVSRDANASLAPGDNPERVDFATFLGRTQVSIEVARRQQEVAIDVDASVNAAADQIELLERFLFDVKYKPLAEASFSIAREVWEQEDLQWELNGEPLDPPETIDDFAYAGPNNDSLTALVRFPQPITGEAVLTVRRSQDTALTRSDETATTALALVMPRDHLRQVTAHVVAQRGLEVQLAAASENDGWTMATSEDPPGDGFRLLCNGPADQLLLDVQTARATARGRLRLERAWLQTWLSGNVQQQRAAYQVVTDRSEVVLSIPDSMSSQSIEVLVDGRPVRPNWDEAGQLHVMLDDESEAPARPQERRYTLEFRSSAERQTGQWLTVAAEGPRITGAENTALAYWQVIVPSNYCVVASPDKMASDYRIGWKNFRWGRHATRSARDLEQWIEATDGLAPSAASNQYLYSSTFGLPDQMQATVVARAWLLAAAASGLLLATCTLLNTSIGRRPEAWLAAALAMLAGAYAFPETVVVFLTGLLLSGAAAATIRLVRTLRRPSRSIAAAAPPPPASIQAAVTDIWPPPLSTADSGAPPIEPVTTGD